jgi:hypothetical protein
MWDPSRAGIHEAWLRKKTVLRVNYFLTLFIDVFLGVFLTFLQNWSFNKNSTINLVDFRNHSLLPGLGKVTPPILTLNTAIWGINLLFFSIY